MDAMVNYASFSSDLPAEGRLRFNSLEENEEVLTRQGLDLAVRQTAKGLFRSDLSTVTSAEATLLSQRINVPLTMHVRAPADTLVFLFPRWVSGQYIISGADVGPENVLVLPEGTGADISIPGLAGSDCIFIRTSRYREMAAALDPNLEPTESMAILDGDSSQLNLLCNAFGTLMAQPRLDVRGECSHSLLTLAVSYLADTVSRGQCDDLGNRSDRIRCARRAADFIEENYAREVRMDTLCRSTGLGIRTLQRCFREHFGINVTEYLKAVRLDAVYRRLDNATPRSTTVARVGIENGYTHLGRLSVQFHERFGKSPSEVLSGN